MKFIKMFDAYINIPSGGSDINYQKKSLPNPWENEVKLDDMELRVPKEYHRTIGFKYSKPNNKYTANIKCDFPKGSSSIVRIAVQSIIDKLDVYNFDLTIKRNEQEEIKDRTILALYDEEVLPERTLVLKFDAYSENEAEYITLEIVKNLSKELKIIANPTIKIRGSKFNDGNKKKLIGFKNFNTPRKKLSFS